MLTKTLIAAGALLSVAGAVPMQQNKRDVVYTTNIEMAYTTVDVTTTVWLQPGETAPAEPAEVPGAPGHYGHGHNYGHHHHKSKVTSHIKSTVTVPPPAPTPSTPAAPSSSPDTTSETYAAPTSSSAAAVTTSAPPPETYSTPAAPTPTSSPAAAPSSYSGGSSGGSGASYTGDLTYYTPGMGSCGVTNTESDAIVALAEGMMTASMPASGNPNDNPLCGKSITISYGGKTATAKIMDTCPGCAGGSLDLTPSLFEVFAPLSEGRLTGMKWSYN